MERVQILDWFIDVDRFASEGAYARQEPNYPASCKCLNCENFAAALDQLPAEFLEICLKLGIDPAKPSEVYELARLEDRHNIHLYAGWYHVIGQVIVKSRGVENPRMIIPSELGSDWCIYFSDNDSMMPSGFPSPFFALEFSGTVPWVLQEQP